jgi:hypothetical protein
MDDRVCGTMTKKQVAILREFLQRFIDICPDADNKIDPADKKRIAKVKKTHLYRYVHSRRARISAGSFINIAVMVSLL